MLPLGFEPRTLGLRVPCASQLRQRSMSNPNGIRTRADALKGRCPEPLDDGAMRTYRTRSFTLANCGDWICTSVQRFQGAALLLSYSAALGWTRTSDIPVFGRALYHLSYLCVSSLRLHSTYEESRLRAGTPSTVQRALRSSLCGCFVLRGPGGSRTPTARGGCFTGSWSQPHDQCRPRAERLAPLRNSWMPIQLSKVQVHRLMLTRRSPTDEAPDVGIEPTPCSFGGCLVAMTCPTCGTTRERCLVALLLVSSPLASDLRGLPAEGLGLACQIRKFARGALITRPRRGQDIALGPGGGGGVQHHAVIIPPSRLASTFFLRSASRRLRPALQTSQRHRRYW